MNLRINKLLSQTGLGSRREVESFVLDRRVTINGQLAELSDIVEEDDVVTLDGEELPVRDLIREYVTEQKMQIAQQTIRIKHEYISADDDESTGFRKSRPNGVNKRAADKGAGNPLYKKTSNGKPAKFRKNREDDEPSGNSRQQKERTSSSFRDSKKSKFDGRRSKEERDSKPFRKDERSSFHTEKDHFGANKKFDKRR